MFSVRIGLYMYMYMYVDECMIHTHTCPVLCRFMVMRPLKGEQSHRLHVHVASAAATCTARPPLLLNHLPHLLHCTAPRCSHTGFCHSLHCTSLFTHWLLPLTALHPTVHTLASATHCTAPRCSHTGFCHSSMHLCPAMPI